MKRRTNLTLLALIALSVRSTVFAGMPVSRPIETAGYLNRLERAVWRVGNTDDVAIVAMTREVVASRRWDLISDFFSDLSFLGQARLFDVSLLEPFIEPIQGLNTGDGLPSQLASAIRDSIVVYRWPRDVRLAVYREALSRDGTFQFDSTGQFLKPPSGNAAWGPNPHIWMSWLNAAAQAEAEELDELLPVIERACKERYTSSESSYIQNVSLPLMRLRLDRDWTSRYLRAIEGAIGGLQSPDAAESVALIRKCLLRITRKAVPPLDKGLLAINEKLQHLRINHFHAQRAAHFSELAIDARLGGDAIGTIYPLGGAVSAPIAINRPSPRLPHSARSRSPNPATTVFILEAIITKAGHVRDIRTLHPPSDASRAETEGVVKAAVARWKFKPATLNGKPVCARISLSVPVLLK
ncbi:MAG: energy transducer TonB [Thermoanaerobaculia bacterium]|nr:energy transducer TonB [Thermoanaerobaculia bacterium]